MFIEQCQIFGAVYMKTLEEIKINRFNFLKKVYEKKTRGGLQIFEASKIAEEIGLEKDEADLIVEFLEGEDLLKTHSDGGELISITHNGKLKIEEALSKPSEATEYFPPVNVIYNYGEMHNSLIMQGSTGSNQTFNLTENTTAELEKFIELFEQRFTDLPFKSEEDKNEAVAEVQTIKTRLSSPRPKLLIIQESIKSVTNILEGFSGSMLATMLIEYLKNPN